MDFSLMGSGWMGEGHFPLLENLREVNLDL